MIKKQIVIVILLLSFLLTVAIRWNGMSGENYRSIINSDGRGYYHYYEAIFSEGLHNQKANDTYLVKTPDDRVLNKYFIGLPLLWSPFVLPVYYYQSSINDTDSVDLYSEGFQKAISLAALFYLLLGLLALKGLLRSFEVEAHIQGFSLFAFFFGTNLSYYTIIAPSMSHVYSFSLIAGFLYLVRRFSIDRKSKHLVFSAAVLGLIILIRPINGLILLAIPIVWKGEFFKAVFLKERLKYLVLAFFVLVMIILIQPLFWKLQTESWIQWSYMGEGFYFSNPEILNFVFSIRKGFLIYTPILFLSLLALLLIFRVNKKRALFAFGFISVLIYFLASWWNWYYGDSYGSRVMIDFLPVFILIYALGLSLASKKLRIAAVVMSLLFVFLNVFQSYQYYHNIMSHFDMNAEKYGYIFLKGGNTYENSLGGNDDLPPYPKDSLEVIYEIKGEGEFEMPYNVYSSRSIDTVLAGQNCEVFLIQGEPFGLTYHLNSAALLSYGKLYAEMHCTTFSREVLNNVYWTVNLSTNLGKQYYYAFRINGIPIGESKQRKDFYRFQIPAIHGLDSKVQISLWNKGQHHFMIGDVRIKLYGIPK